MVGSGVLSILVSAILVSVEEIILSFVMSKTYLDLSSRSLFLREKISTFASYCVSLAIAFSVVINRPGVAGAVL